MYALHVSPSTSGSTVCASSYDALTSSEVACQLLDTAAGRCVFTEGKTERAVFVFVPSVSRYLSLF
jgi:hypothetical protein